MADFLIVLGAITLVLLITLPVTFIAAWIGTWLAKLTERVAERLSEGSGRIERMAEPEEKVFLLSFEIDQGNGDYAGWTSPHRSKEGAERRLRQKVREWGLEDEFESGELEYSISVLTLED